MVGPILDLKDNRIIKQLDINSRQSNNQIAKKVGLSKDAVRYRIEKLEKQGLIKGYYSVLNISKLGYLTYKLMLNFQDSDVRVKKEIIDYLTQDKNTGWVVSCDGHYNLIVISWVENPFVFEEFLNKFLEKYSRYVSERDLMLITENHSSGRAYLFDEKYDHSPDIYYKKISSIPIDKIDIKIINLLVNNAKMPLYEISNKLKLTPGAVSYRIRQLQKKEIIQAFRPIINITLLDYEYYNILFRLKKFSRIKEIFTFFKQHPNIIYFVKYLGKYDIGIDLEVKNAKELRTILEEVKTKFSKDIESYIFLLIYNQHKLSYYPG
ncbi:MAG: AsnC family transcriptional regulator [Nanoarchaeota archaeon]|nr:AsnC family transcriptional regulator [Nanoarchaeota archaeon]